jgi:hypothetical protein
MKMRAVRAANPVRARIECLAPLPLFNFDAISVPSPFRALIG